MLSCMNFDVAKVLFNEETLMAQMTCKFYTSGVAYRKNICKHSRHKHLVYIAYFIVGFVNFG